MAKKHIRKISFLVAKSELNLLKEASLLGAGLDENIENVKKKKGKYETSFFYEELDDLIGIIAHCSGHEKSERKQDRWDKLFDRLNNLLELCDNLSEYNKAQKADKQYCNLQYYIFDVWIANDNSGDKIFRKIQIPKTKSLYNFAEVIVKAFDFYFDHCFGFYDNFQKYHDSKKMYELFADIDEEPVDPKAKGVKKTKICQAFKKSGEKLLFFFDYGQCWRFIVELKEIKNATKWDFKPVILKSIGKAPPQYPPCDEDGVVR